MEGLPVFIAGFVAGALVTSVALILMRPWIAAVAAGAPISVVRLLGMRLRRVPVDLILDAHVALAKRGEPAELSLIETVYLAHRSNVKNEQHLVSLVRGHAERLPDARGE